VIRIGLLYFAKFPAQQFSVIQFSVKTIQWLLSTEH
jgi:hypothetical protein